jgi:pentose-5-phosphate-3-epimerase
LNKSNVAYLSIQYENLVDKKELDLLSEYHGKWGIGILSTTPLSVLENYIKSINHVLVMCTVPGISGAKFDPINIERIETINMMFPSLNVFVDGGIEHLNAKIMRNKNVELIVSGSYLSNAESLYQNLYNLKYGDQQFFVSQVMISTDKLPIQNSSSSFLDILKKVSEFKIGIPEFLSASPISPIFFPLAPSLNS